MASALWVHGGGKKAGAETLEAHPHQWMESPVHLPAPVRQTERVRSLTEEKLRSRQRERNSVRSKVRETTRSSDETAIQPPENGLAIGLRQVNLGGGTVGPMVLRGSNGAAAGDLSI